MIVTWVPLTLKVAVPPMSAKLSDCGVLDRTVVLDELEDDVDEVLLDDVGLAARVVEVDEVGDVDDVEDFGESSSVVEVELVDDVVESSLVGEVTVVLVPSSSLGSAPTAAEATSALPPMRRAVTAPVMVALRFMGNLLGGMPSSRTRGVEGLVVREDFSGSVVFAGGHDAVLDANTKAHLVLWVRATEAHLDFFTLVVFDRVVPA